MKTTIAILTACIITIICAQARDTYLTYDEFIRLAETGKIQSVELTKYSSIAGNMTTTEGLVAFKSYASTGSAQDPLLNRLLKEQDIKVSLGETEKQNSSFSFIMGFSGLSMMLVPWACLVLLILCFRRLGCIQKQTKC